MDRRFRLGLLFLLSFPNRIYACSCSMSGSLPVWVSREAVLLVGTVFAVENPPPDDEKFVGTQDSEIDTPRHRSPGRSSLTV